MYSIFKIDNKKIDNSTYYENKNGNNKININIVNTLFEKYKNDYNKNVKIVVLCENNNKTSFFHYLAKYKNNTLVKIINNKNVFCLYNIDDIDDECVLNEINKIKLNNFESIFPLNSCKKIFKKIINVKKEYFFNNIDKNYVITIYNLHSKKNYYYKCKIIKLDNPIILIKNSKNEFIKLLKYDTVDYIKSKDNTFKIKKINDNEYEINLIKYNKFHEIDYDINCKKLKS